MRGYNMESKAKDYLDAVFIVGLFIFISPLIFNFLYIILQSIRNIHADAIAPGFSYIVDYITMMLMFTGLLMLLYVVYIRYIKNIILKQLHP
jgi:cytochrome c biogenesis protein CcdA